MDEQEEIGVSTQQQHHCYHPLLYIQNTGKESLYLSKAVTMATKSQEQSRVEYFTLLGSSGPPDVTGQRLLQHLILPVDQVLQIVSLGVSAAHTILWVLHTEGCIFTREVTHIFLPQDEAFTAIT